MPAANTDKLRKKRSNFSTTLSSGIDNSTGTVPLSSVTGLPTDTAITLTIDRVDSNGVALASNLKERITGVVSGSNVTNSLRGQDNTSAGSHSAGAVVEDIWDADTWNDMVDWGLVEHNQDGTHRAASASQSGFVELATTAETTTGTDATRAVTPDGLHDMTSLSGAAWMLDEDNMSSDSDTKVASQQSIKAYVDLRRQGSGLINGKIVTSVSSNNLTVAIKTLANADPSATDPVYVRIGNTVRAITAALSVTKNAGTNWFGAGSATLATKEIDYFVYIGYNATDGVVVGFSRIPYANFYGDFSTTTTAVNYAAISTITTASSTDDYVLIGRFNAILSATASFNWSIPATSIIVQRPIFQTRMLEFVPQLSASGSMTYTSTSIYYARYQLDYVRCHVTVGFTGTTGGSAGTQVISTLPMTQNAIYTSATQAEMTAFLVQAGTGEVGRASLREVAGSIVFFRVAGANWSLGATSQAYYENNYFII